MNRATQRAVAIFIVRVVLFLIGAGIWCGARLGQLKTDLFGSNSELERVKNQLTNTQAALGEAETTRKYLREVIAGIGRERDTLVEKFGVIRSAVEGLRAGIAAGDDIIDEGIRALNVVIDSLEYLEGIRIWD